MAILSSIRENPFSVTPILWGLLKGAVIPAMAEEECYRFIAVEKIIQGNAIVNVR